MKMIIIGVAALLLLGGAGAGAYFYFAKPAEAASAEVEEAGKKHDEAKKEGGHGGGGGHGEGGGVDFVKLDPLILPIIDSEGVTQVVSLVVAIEVASPEDKDAVTKLVPRLQDAYIQQLYGELGNQSGVKDGVIQVAIIKKKLNEITGKVLGGEIAKDVLLQVVQQRPT